MTDETTTTKKPVLSPIEVGAGAGAAVIVAFASSYLGTAGTLTGAAVASVIGTVSTSVLRNSARTSAHRLKQTTTRLRDTRVTDVRPVESEDVDRDRTQFLAAANWIDPEGRSAATGADPGSTWDPPTQHLTRPAPHNPSTTSWSAPGPTDRGAAGPAPWSAGGPADSSATGRTPWPVRDQAQPGAAEPAPWSAGGAPRSGATGSTRPGAPWPPAGPARPGAVGSDRRSGTGGGGASWPEGTSAGVVGGAGSGASRPVTAAGGSAGLRGIRGRWVVVGAGAVAAFALALGAITGIEAAAGKPLSGLAGRESGGGTTLGRATGADSGSDRSTPSPTPAPTTGGATSTAPVPGTGRTVSPTAPSTAPASPTPSPTQQAPTQAPTPSAPSQQTP